MKWFEDFLNTSTFNVLSKVSEHDDFLANIREEFNFAGFKPQSSFYSLAEIKDGDRAWHNCFDEVWLTMDADHEEHELNE